MQDKEKLRKILLGYYERLTPLQKALLHLCSVIYEKTNITNIYHCLRNSGLTFYEEPVSSIGALKPHLDELQRLKLLDKQFRCHQAIVEVITRIALEEQPEIAPDTLLLEITKRSSWVEEQTAQHVCLSCQKSSSGPFLKISSGFLCQPCVLSELKRTALTEDLNSWSGSQFKQALSPEADLYKRLTVIWRFEEVLQISARENPSRVDELMALLVQQLGLVDPPPVARMVRQVAVDAVRQLGAKILPVLLTMCKTEPWQFYANVILAAGSIAPENKEVRAILEQATRDPNPKVRKNVVAALCQHTSGWSKGMLQTLYHDRDAAVREYVKAISWGVDLRLNLQLPVKVNQTSALRRYDILVKAVRKELPVHLDLFHLSTHYCQRIMRELRIGIYSHDVNLCQKSRDLLLNGCAGTPYTQFDPFTHVVMNPFDLDWLRTLPLRLQCMLLNSIFQDTIRTLEQDNEPLGYALSPGFLDSLQKAQKNYILPGLVSRLLIGGRLAEAQELLFEPDNVSFFAATGLVGWLLFVTNKNDEAISAFQEDLKRYRKISKKRSVHFTGLPGIFYVLALIRRGDANLWKDVDEIVSKVLSSNFGDAFLDSTYSSLKAIVLAENCELDSARRLIAKAQDQSGLPVFFSALAAYWLDGSLSQERIDSLSQVFVASREIGLSWLAMESAELLCRTEQRTPIRRNYIHNVQEETGMQSLLPTLRIEEGWRRRLRALRKVAEPENGQVDQPREVRLIWLLGFHGSTVTLQAKEQKISAKGSWTKGRLLPFSRLLDSKDLEAASKQDEAVIAAIEQSSPYYYHDFKFNMDKALPALVGHPLVFLEENPSVPIEIVRGEPEIIVSRSGSNLSIKIAPSISSKRVLLLRETPTRFRVLEFSDAHRRIGQLLGQEGLIVPASAEQDVSEAIANISSLVTVHSAIGGAVDGIAEVEADTTPYMHLMPAGSGFRIEMFVKPFTDGGPYVKPGIGANNLIADVDGKRMQARRDLDLERQRAAAVEADSAMLTAFAEGERRWLLEDAEECLQVLLDLKTLQDRGEVIVEWPEGEKLKVAREASFDQFQMRIRSKTDWFELSGQLQVDSELVLDMKQLLDLLNTTNSRFIPLGEGQFIALTQELRKRLEDLNAYSEKHGKSIGLHPLAALAIEDLTRKLAHLDADSAWKKRLDRIRSAQTFTPLLSSTFKGKLRDYQMEGYRWLARLMTMGVGACLADDMGLGKTIQALALILDRAPQGPSLVVAPTSVCMNWLTEANRFAPTLNMHQLGANGREALIRNLQARDVLVTSYGLLHQEVELLASVQWSVIVLDEAQAIKNITTKRSQAAMNLKGDFKLITTGTPIENHLSELWTLFNFINRGLLGSLKKFNERFAIPIERYNDQEAKKRLKKLIQPFILRRTKSQVLEELPPRTDVLLRVEMSPEEAAFYEALRRQSIERLQADNTPLYQKHLKILAEIMRLRQAACNPRLVVPESNIPSAKLELFGEIISELLENGHKALVFSQFVGHLSLIREYLDRKHIDYRYLDGGTPPAERKREVDAFQAGRGDLFLISLKAGGLGLNLTAADYVIHMDPWWNPAVEDQASDRTHRIGQQHPVTVYRLVTETTIEEKIVKLHQDKRDLAGSLLEGADLSAKISAEELLQLIQEP